jgi:hypothetical protein
MVLQRASHRSWRRLGVLDTKLLKAPGLDDPGHDSKLYNFLVYVVKDQITSFAEVKISLTTIFEESL